MTRWILHYRCPLTSADHIGRCWFWWLIFVQKLLNCVAEVDDADDAALMMLIYQKWLTEIGFEYWCPSWKLWHSYRWTSIEFSSGLDFLIIPCYTLQPKEYSIMWWEYFQGVKNDKVSLVKISSAGSPLTYNIDGQSKIRPGDQMILKPRPLMRSIKVIMKCQVHGMAMCWVPGKDLRCWFSWLITLRTWWSKKDLISNRPSDQMILKIQDSIVQKYKLRRNFQN